MSGDTSETRSTSAEPTGGPARRGCKWVFFLMFALLALAAGIAATVYFGLVRSDADPRRHLPRGTNVAARVDAVTVIAFEPVRRRVLPVLMNAKSRTDGTEESVRDRLHALTGIRLPDDLREAVVGSVDGTQWIAAFGGKLEPGRFVDGLEKLLGERGVEGFRREGDLLVHTTGLALGQADDGTLVVATGKSTALAALPSHDVDENLALPMEGALSFVATPAATRGAIGLLPSFVTERLDTLDKVARFRGAFLLGEAPRLEVRLQPRGVAPSELATTLESELGPLKLAMALLPSDLGGGRQALASATVRVDGEEALVTAPWPYASLDEAAQRAAEILGVALAQPTPPK